MSDPTKGTGTGGSTDPNDTPATGTGADTGEGTGTGSGTGSGDAVEEGENTGDGETGRKPTQAEKDARHPHGGAPGKSEGGGRAFGQTRGGKKDTDD